MRIPIRYDSFLISNGRKGAERAVVGRGLHHTVFRDAADREVSAHDHHIAGLTGMDPGDVATFRAVAMECQVLFVVRCPGVSTGRFATLGIPVTGKPEEEKEGLKVGNDLVRRGNGQLIVGDYDLMSVWLAEGGRYERLEFTRDGPGHAARWTNLDAERLFDRLNRDLNIPVEHGANDDWKTANATCREIRQGAVVGRRRFVAFAEGGGYRLLPDPGALKRYYADVLKAGWPYA
ncbi:hypothetical protein LPC08_07795 [Roseomonas sp. OT10]|uniref:hypothetical protein n=1 Tax=Roseomonas cutis TaxID=2897332 RepID=UPI001E4794D1|nr:hypothetical protein [Roseomonas sp. OT10]UFN50508.1 hypothetical protein LPC08_07795 [Roseomonas sp. OT10]